MKFNVNYYYNQKFLPTKRHRNIRKRQIEDTLCVSCTELTKEEFEERARLRKEYIEEFRAGAMQILDNVYVQTPDGVKHKLERKQ